MSEQEARAEYFRQAEVSNLLEGLDGSGDTFYQALKARVISGEIDMDEGMRLLLDDCKAIAAQHAADLAKAS